MSYLIVDAVEDTVLATCESSHDLVPLLEYIQRQEPGREVIVVRFGEHRGELFGGQSHLTVRTLSDAEGFALYGR